MNETNLINLFLVIINLIVLALCLKLYTEYFKDVSNRNRNEKNKKSEQKDNS